MQRWEVGGGGGEGGRKKEEKGKKGSERGRQSKRFTDRNEIKEEVSVG